MSSPAESATASALISDVLCRRRHQFFAGPNCHPDVKRAGRYLSPLHVTYKNGNLLHFGRVLIGAPVAAIRWLHPVLLIPAKRVTDR